MIQLTGPRSPTWAETTGGLQEELGRGCVVAPRCGSRESAHRAGSASAAGRSWQSMFDRRAGGRDEPGRATGRWCPRSTPRRPGRGGASSATATARCGRPATRPAGVRAPLALTRRARSAASPALRLESTAAAPRLRADDAPPGGGCWARSAPRWRRSSVPHVRSAHAPRARATSCKYQERDPQLADAAAVNKA